MWTEFFELTSSVRTFPVKNVLCRCCFRIDSKLQLVIILTTVVSVCLSKRVVCADVQVCLILFFFKYEDKLREHALSTLTATMLFQPFDVSRVCDMESGETRHGRMERDTGENARKTERQRENVEGCHVCVCIQGCLVCASQGERQEDMEASTSTNFSFYQRNSKLQIFSVTSTPELQKRNWFQQLISITQMRMHFQPIRSGIHADLAELII